QHFQGVGRTRCLRQRTVEQQLVVNLDFFGDTDAVGHLHDVNTIEKGFIVFVVAEGLPFRLVRMGEYRAFEGNRAHTLGAVVVTLLSGSQQRVQHLDGRLEHLDEFHDALVGATQAAGKCISIGIALRKFLKLADIDFTHQCRNILVVFVTGFGLADGDLIESRRIQLDYAEAADVALVFVQPFYSPRRHDSLDVAARNAVVLFEDLAVFFGIEQPQWRLEYGGVFEAINGLLLDQRFEAFGQRRFAATYGAEQVQNLFLFFQTLSRMTEVRDDLLDRFLHAVEFVECFIATYDFVLENS